MIWIMLLRWVTKITVWLSIILFICLFAFATGFSFYKYTEIKNQNVTEEYKLPEEFQFELDYFLNMERTWLILGGRNDCYRHCQTATHVSNSKPKNCRAVTDYFASSTRPKQKPQESISAELIMCSFIVQQNISFASMDTLSECIREAFPDSKIAAGFKCGRTKTTSLIKELSGQEILRLAGLMRERPFSVATDGSNDTSGGKKYYPLVVKVAGPDGVESGLLALANCDGQSTGNL
ncbi:connexin 27.5 [Elysia marginata]|uniref:Connexin 27.5 n=1 Tax=Elysia marginata TaxID=1093978 RepID=A0AAV4FKP7_9GAST|nr:connexin 27.5 [Elysia marginata]